MNIIQQARRLLGGRNPSSEIQWVGQFGFACPQLGVHDYVWGANRVVNQGINHLLNAGLRGSPVITLFYIAPFVADIAPAATLTAANFGSTLTEFTNYTQATRPVWTSDAAATVQLLENALVPATMTIDTGAQTSIYGAALISNNGKGSTAGSVIAAAKAPSPFLNLAAGFEVKIKYKISGTSS